MCPKNLKRAAHLVKSDIVLQTCLNYKQLWTMGYFPEDMDHNNNIGMMQTTQYGSYFETIQTRLKNYILFRTHFLSSLLADALASIYGNFYPK